MGNQKYNLMRLPHLHKICGTDELREVLTCVYCDTNGYFVATDGHMLVAVHYTETDIDKAMYKKAMGKLIHYETWKKLVYDCDVVAFTGRNIHAMNLKENRWIDYSYYKLSNDKKKFWRDTSYPDYKQIIWPNDMYTDGGIDYIGFNPTFAKLIKDVFKSVDAGEHLIFHFSNKSNAILMRGHKWTGGMADVYGLIMPQYIESSYGGIRLTKEEVTGDFEDKSLNRKKRLTL